MLMTDEAAVNPSIHPAVSTIHRRVSTNRLVSTLPTRAAPHRVSTIPRPRVSTHRVSTRHPVSIHRRVSTRPTVGNASEAIVAHPRRGTMSRQRKRRSDKCMETFERYLAHDIV